MSLRSQLNMLLEIHICKARVTFHFVDIQLVVIVQLFQKLSILQAIPI